MRQHTIIAFVVVAVLFVTYLFGVWEYVGCGFCEAGKARMALRGMGCFYGNYEVLEGEGFTAYSTHCGVSRIVDEYSDLAVEYSGVVVIRDGKVVSARKVEGCFQETIYFVAQEEKRPECGAEINESLFNISGKVNCEISFPYRK